MTTSLKLLRIIPGHLFGLRKPSILLEITRLKSSRANELTSMTKLLQMVAEVQQAAGFSDCEQGKLLQLIDNDEGETLARLLVPCPLGMVENAIEIVKTLLEQGSSAIHQAGLNLKQAGPKSSNTPRILSAANSLHIPITPIGPEVYQFGYGSAARWMESTFTDRTGNLSVRMARDKVWASSMLRNAGLPVPQNQLVNNADSAVEHANRIGFPVVIKPADLDGGVGVAANLDNDEEVRAAFHQAQKHSKNILVEKHIQGQDYRLTVINGKLLWAINRIPAGVTGDGVQTVAELVDRCNADPQRGDGPHAPLKKIVLDEESRQLLDKQQLQLQTIPPQGQFVQLRRAANVATGGMPVKVLDSVHPDNAALAIRAAEVLRLDIAGIDLLIPDIAQSWLESGGAICEINAQPQIGAVTGPHLYGEILKTLLTGKGRIPIVVVLGSLEDTFAFDSVARHCQTKGLRTGTVFGGQVRLNKELIGHGSSFSGSQALLRNPIVDCVVLAVSDLSLLTSGLAFDRFDHLIVNNVKLDGLHDIPEKRSAMLHELMATLLPACEKSVINLSDSGLTFKSPIANSNAELIELARDHEDAAQTIENILNLS